MKKTTGILILLLLLSQFLPGQNREDDTTHIQQPASRSFQEIRELAYSGNFVFVADRTIPTTGNSISLITNRNHISFNSGTVDILLPYFGIVYSGAGYNHEAGIQYNGDPNNYSLDTNEEKQRIRISFEITDGAEAYTFSMTVWKNGFATVLLKSSGRSTSSYDGYVRSSKVLE
jgi:hypothetical protein